jgi:hypothetical protein
MREIRQSGSEGGALQTNAVSLPLSQSLTFPGCLGRGPGSRALAAESIGRVSPFPGGSDRLPQDEAGRSGRPPVAPTRSQNRRGNPRPVGPTRLGPRSCLMISAGNALDSGPGNRGMATFRWCPFIICFERPKVFQASGSAGGHDFQQMPSGD